jgi:esterase/lipase superfamily enzyme
MERRFDESGAREALVFVHGYRVTFDAAIRRTGQIAHDLRFEGTPILYSWPSAGRLLRYAQDETSARWTEPHFIRFLQVLLNESAAEAVHVIAHSMGTRIVSECLRNLPPAINTSKLDQVVLAAPDIDAETFKDMAGALEGRTKQVTMYASSRDLALRVSKLVHGYPRAGDTDPEVVLVKPVMTVDASSVDTNLLGHAYVGDDKSILADIFHLLQSRATPDQRRFFLDPAEQNGERYWVFVT